MANVQANAPPTWTFGLLLVIKWLALFLSAGSAVAWHRMLVLGERPGWTSPIPSAASSLYALWFLVFAMAGVLVFTVTDALLPRPNLELSSFGSNFAASTSYLFIGYGFLSVSLLIFSFAFGEASLVLVATSVEGIKGAWPSQPFGFSDLRVPLAIAMTTIPPLLLTALVSLLLTSYAASIGERVYSPLANLIGSGGALIAYLFCSGLLLRSITAYGALVGLSGLSLIYGSGLLPPSDPRRAAPL